LFRKVKKEKSVIEVFLKIYLYGKSYQWRALDEIFSLIWFISKNNRNYALPLFHQVTDYLKQHSNNKTPVLRNAIPVLGETKTAKTYFCFFSR